MSLGDVAQVAAAFIVVQGALNWFVDNYQRLADWLSSVNRVSSLLLALDKIEMETCSGGPINAEAPGLLKQTGGTQQATQLQRCHRNELFRFSRLRRRYAYELRSPVQRTRSRSPHHL